MHDVTRTERFESSRPAGGLALPGPKVAVRIRPGRLSDYDFIDGLQKLQNKALGFMYASALKGHIEQGHVLVAEAAGPEDAGCRVSDVGVEQDAGCRVSDVGQGSEASNPRPTTCNPQPTASPASPVGYIIAVDRYMKRDELGIIYQINVAPGSQRRLVAANLLRAQFERSAYGCRLYCCWCAQDLEHASRFWEACGFVPLAFRTGGGRNKKDGPRMHIFWQKRIREGDYGVGHPDTTSGGGGTAYWFPGLTGAGSIGEDRIVLPIPPGTHWSDAKPVVLPNGPRNFDNAGDDEIRLLEAEVKRLEKEKKAAGKQTGPAPVVQSAPPPSVEAGGLHFAPGICNAPGSSNGPGSSNAPGSSNGKGSIEERALEKEKEKERAAAVELELKAAKKAIRRAKKKFDPAQVAFARELKDRWLEQVLAEPGLIAPGREKYAVCRQVGAGDEAVQETEVRRIEGGRAAA